MSNKVFKNYQVNVGNPFQVRAPISYHNIRTVETINQDLDEPTTKDTIDTEEILSKAKEEAQLIVDEAHFEALRITQNAEAEADKHRIFVEEEARTKGYNEGLNEAKMQYEDLIRETELIKENANLEYKEVLEGIENDAVEVIMAIARKVIGAEISFHKEDILYLVKQAFEKCSNKESIVLKVSPEDYDYIAANKDRLLAMVEGVGDLKVKKDNSLKVGACMVETPFGSIDAGVQTKLDNIEKAFRAAIGK